MTIQEYETMVQEEYPRIFRFCLSLLMSYDEASEATNDVFYSLYKKNGYISHPRPLLFRAARNKCIDHIRKSRAKAGRLNEVLLTDDLLANLVAIYSTNDVMEDLLDCISRLPEKEQSVVDQFMQGKPLREIAEEHSLTGHVGAIWRRIKNTLKQCLIKKGQTLGQR